MKSIFSCFMMLFIAVRLSAQTDDGLSKPFKLKDMGKKKIEEVKPKMPPPLIVLLNPATNTKSAVDQYSVKAVIKNVENENNVNLKIAGHELNNKPIVSKTKDGFEFIWEIKLTEGTNKITILAKNETKQETKQFEIQYDKPRIILTPEITLLHPKSGNSKTSFNTTDIEAKIKNAKLQNNITLKLNEQEVKAMPSVVIENDFLNLVWNKILIEEGINNFKIIAKNESKEDSKEFTISYQKLLPPMITVIAPENKAKQTTNPIETIIADITNIDESAMVILKRKGEDKKIEPEKKDKIPNGFKFTWLINMGEGISEYDLVVSQNTLTKSERFAFRYTEPESPSFKINLWAVVVGVSEYQNPSISLKYAASDAKSFYDLLKDTYPEDKIKSQVSLLLDKDATRSKILREIKSKFKEAKENDLIILYLACHGTLENNRVHFLPYDTDPSDLAINAIKDIDIQDVIQESRANKKILIADACHSGGGKKTRDISPLNDFILKLAMGEGSYSLTSASGSEKAVEGEQWGGHGVFTYYLIKGLKGEADFNKDKSITIKEIYEFVRDNVKRETNSAQNPKLEDNGSNTDLPIGYLK